MNKRLKIMHKYAGKLTLFKMSKKTADESIALDEGFKLANAMFNEIHFAENHPLENMTGEEFDQLINEELKGNE